MSDFSNSDKTLESYKIIFESSLDAILLTHPDGTIFYANSAVEKLYGYTQQEICNLGRIGIVDTNDPNLQVIMDERARLGKSKGELTLIKKDGSKFPAEISTSLFKDENGNTNTFTTIRDITHRKQNEKQIEYHALLLSKVNDAVIGADSNFIITYWNNGAELMFGFTGKEAIGKSSVELLRPIYAPGEREIIINELKNKGNSKSTISTKHRNGTEIIVEVNSSRILDEQKDISGYVVVYRDITERKQVEKRTKELLESEQQLVEELQTSNEELQSTTNELQVTNKELHQQEDKLLQTYNDLKVSEERFRSIIENIQDAYIRTDKEGTITMASPSAARMYRFNSTQEMLGTTTHSYFKNSEDRDFAIEQLKKHGKYTDYEVEARRKDGTYFWVSQNAQNYYDDQGKIQGRESIVRDITVRKGIEAALKKSERSLDEAQHISHIGSWEWNIKTSDITWSKELYSIYGVDPNNFIPTLHSFADYLHPDDQEYVDKITEQIITEGKSVNFDFRIILDNGSIRILNTLAEISKFDKNGNPLRVVGTNQDITERKEIELKLNENIEKLAQSNKELEQFAYITSHDLREPLRMITSFLQLLERRYKDQLDQNANEFIGFAVNGAKRLDAMTNDLLKYSKITNEKRDIIPVNFEHVLEHTLTNLKVQIEENNAIITHDPLPTINGNEELKIQLFQNIIGNAIKYRSQKTPKIHISAIKEKNQYIFSIKDNGIGMSPKHLEKIFTIFQRLHTQEEYEGTGIGLAIAQKIVHQQGGQIWAESEPRKGTTFYFTIPV